MEVDTHARSLPPISPSRSPAAKHSKHGRRDPLPRAADSTLFDRGIVLAETDAITALNSGMAKNMSSSNTEAGVKASRPRQPRSGFDSTGGLFVNDDDETVEESRLPALLSVKPEQGAVRLRELSEIEAENRSLQFQLNKLSAERTAKELQCVQLQAAADDPLPVGGLKPLYLQQQIWAVEQAFLAEMQYTDALDKIHRQSRDDARCQELNGTKMQRDLYLADCELTRVRGRGERIVALRKETNRRLRELKEDLVSGGNGQLEQLEQLGRARSTLSEQSAKRAGRQHRRNHVVLREAGDMDAEGEEALRVRAAATQRDMELSQMTLQQTMVHLNILEVSMTKLRRVTGANETVAMIQRFFAQQHIYKQIQANMEQTQQKLEKRQEEYASLVQEEQAVKMLSGRSGDDRALTSSILDMKQEIKRKETTAYNVGALQLSRFKLLSTRTRNAMAGLAKRVAQLDVGDGTRLGSAHRLPEGVKSKLASTLEESEVLPVFNVLEARLVALLSNFEAVVPAANRHESPSPMRLAVRVPRDALALRRVQSLSATPPSAELLGDRKAGMQDNSIVRRQFLLGGAGVGSSTIGSSAPASETEGSDTAGSPKRSRRRRAQGKRRSRAARR